MACPWTGSSFGRPWAWASCRPRKFQVHPLEGPDNPFGHQQVAVPLVVGGNDVPRRPRGAAPADGVLVGGHELLPVSAVLPIHRIDLPGLERVLQALFKALLLLLFRDVQEELESGHAALGQELLEIVDRLVASAPDRPGDEPAD